MDNQKIVAAEKAVDFHFKNGLKIGIGSGTTIVYVVDKIIDIMRVRDYDAKFIPTSFQSRQLILERGLNLSDLEQCPILDIAIDGADEIDRNLNLIKGGGGCLTQEKIVASCAEKLIIVADSSKKVDFLGQTWTKGIPIEVIPMAYRPIINSLKKYNLQSSLRMCGSGKMGPVVTDNGNFIIDAKFEKIEDVDSLNKTIKLIPGVVETGLFVNMFPEVIFGMDDGSIERYQAPY